MDVPFDPPKDVLNCGADIASKNKGKKAHYNYFVLLKKNTFLKLCEPLLTRRVTIVAKHKPKITLGIFTFESITCKSLNQLIFPIPIVVLYIVWHPLGNTKELRV